jgi:hypothetical protein
LYVSKISKIKNQNLIKIAYKQKRVIGYLHIFNKGALIMEIQYCQGSKPMYDINIKALIQNKVCFNDIYHLGLEKQINLSAIDEKRKYFEKVNINKISPKFRFYR